MAPILETSIISLENEAFRSYVFWSAVLVVKMLVMSILTGRQRHSKKAFVNPEDLRDKQLKLTYNDPDVERVRRAHRNDLENILPFFTIGFFYLLTSPTTYIAVNIFRAVGIARIVHTLAYAVFAMKQPTRGIAWFVAFAATFFMAVQTILFFL